ncbi:MAG: Cation-transporting ATPase, E1-E2 family [Candidatus Gottesmanbacteria bacterium GW2011_GWA1_43_11]|uniref:Cation-transporting ATPase, E1-E2 family n=1 Tax=Candidatus Gottesmanbacteria bacterium GW2011_GWA1_43_11 TaxID=1618436 RepID=A0A0G1CHF8_9BACT|nr:MAG: Cation-transporting ATPase, E1-E2 family [Candidatus Gottesmanbacteria bacterium GW2011_GWA1_43_11]
MDKSSGLSSQEAREKLKQHGYNVLPESAPTPDLEIFVRQLKSPLIYILVIAAGISFALKDVTDTIVIMMAVVVNTILGFYQERKAERGLVALKRILSPRAKVIRDGKQQEVEIKYLVR